ncbi:MAG: 30S ribosomal protein S13 [Legionellales bacterium]|nr:30S ribosomal protein S13 [Legionellales bacterium]|tara:strand:+ start:3807 stop:4160 length:354 start_codon:yes stop_codon:yes gene_type:complete
MVTVSGVVLKENQHIEIALTYIYGVGRSSAQKICEELTIPFSKRVSELSESDFDGIRSKISKMVVEGDCRRRKRMFIKAKMDKGSYQGKRHRLGLPVRGQNTQSNAQTRKKRKRRDD